MKTTCFFNKSSSLCTWNSVMSFFWIQSVTKVTVTWRSPTLGRADTTRSRLCSNPYLNRGWSHTKNTWDGTQLNIQKVLNCSYAIPTESKSCTNKKLTFCISLKYIKFKLRQLNVVSVQWNLIPPMKTGSWWHNINGLEPDCSNLIHNALKLLQSRPELSIQWYRSYNYLYHLQLPSTL